MNNLIKFRLKYSPLLFFSALLIVMEMGCSSSHKIESISDNKIRVESEFKRNLKGKENHLYSIQLKAGDKLHIKAEQYGIDVMAKVLSIDSSYTEVFDSPTGELDGEDIYLLSNEDRKYSIDIYPAQKYADPGEYVLKIVSSGKASEADRAWMMALIAVQKADKLRAKSETRQQSIQEYESAMSAWMVLKDSLQYARTKRSLGFVYIRLKEYDKAVELFTQQVSLWKQLGDDRSAGFTWLIMGRIFDLQKNYSKSLDYNLNSLPFWEKTKDIDQESFTLMNIGNLYSYLRDRQKTDESFKQALKKNELSARPSVKAVILRDYANSLMRLGEEEKAIPLYEQSLVQWQRTLNTPEEARTAVLLAEYFSQKANQKEAIHYYQHALSIWQKMDEQKEMKIIQEALTKLHK